MRTKEGQGRQYVTKATVTVVDASNRGVLVGRRPIHCRIEKGAHDTKTYISVGRQANQAWGKGGLATPVRCPRATADVRVYNTTNRCNALRLRTRQWVELPLNHVILLCTPSWLASS